MSRVFVGLGSNQGDSRALLGAALVRLEARVDGHLGKVSSLYRTAPVGYTRQPDFLNAVAMFRGQGRPEEWLDHLLAVEAELGRRRDGPRWGPRPVDLDLLAVEARILETPRLTLPHPRIRERRFVLEPWAEVAADFALPDDRTVAELLAACPDQGTVARVAGPEWAGESAHEEGGGP
ncbi:MAG TPA: 2-amino-4-hydroxy-6-hydroxymethyldihydropteridine diphosphokinase [Gammaproteobacteria bacterium]|nr:2-amino-4-hydroxy-6-hydroxymethyldihydropteridine diphosphokinase [Gammaproteobacteria bacterium]